MSARTPSPTCRTISPTLKLSCTRWSTPTLSVTASRPRAKLAWPAHTNSRPPMRYAPLMPFMALLSACATHPISDAHVPPFARVPYEPLARDAVVAIALREWRLFGSPVDDDPPGTYRPASSEDKPERQQGLWQRVGEYWWLGLDAGAPEAGWTGRHDA